MTLNLSACRSSHVSISLDVAACFYGVLSSILGFTTRSSSETSVSATRFASLYFGRGILPLPLAMSPFQMGYGGPKEGHTWTWIRHCSVSPCTQDLQAARLSPSSSLPALTPCSCPLQVSHPGKVPVLAVSLSTSPVFLTGIQAAVYAAHKRAFLVYPPSPAPCCWLNGKLRAVARKIERHARMEA